MNIDTPAQKMTVEISFSFYAEVFEGEDDMFEVASAELPDMEHVISHALDSNYDNVTNLDIKIKPDFR